MWNFQGSWFLALEFTRDLTQFYGIPIGKLKILKTPGGSKKACPQPLFALVCFFSGIVQYGMGRQSIDSDGIALNFLKKSDSTTDCSMWILERFDF